jgi:hypothetical protein
MPLQQLKCVNFGKSKMNATGSLGVGYALYDLNGVEIFPRTTDSVYQVAPGLYSCPISFPDNFRGQIVWDTGSAFSEIFYAHEQYNYEENNPKTDEIFNKVNEISGTVGSLYDIQFGRWKIENNKMKFFKEDNLTLVAEFDLKDENGNPTMDAVFDRIRA